MDSKITIKGQTTIPKPIRQHLGLTAGGRVRYFVLPDGRVILLPKLPAAALRSPPKYRGPPASLEDMDEAIAAGAAREPSPDQE